jgi:hypothetical protein
MAMVANVIHNPTIAAVAAVHYHRCHLYHRPRHCLVMVMIMVMVVVAVVVCVREQMYLLHIDMRWYTTLDQTHLLVKYIK